MEKHIVVVVAATLVFVSVVIKNTISEPVVLSSVNEITPTPVQSPVPVTPSPTPSVPPATAKPTASSTPVSQGAGDWVYPGSIKSADTYETTDAPDTVTEWYRTKIIQSGSTVKNFVQTKSNNVVNNSLQGVTAQGTVSIQIFTSQGSTKTKIRIDISR